MKQYLVDAFTDRVFSGNPAAVCVLEGWPDEALMKSIALENNLSETAFTVREEDGYRLRWFTPKEEINLCGHATLAAAFVLLNEYLPLEQKIRFHTVSGDLTVIRKGELYEMDFPLGGQREIEVSGEMEAAFGARPVKAFLGMDLVCIFENERIIRNLTPDPASLMLLPGRLQHVTAPGEKADCVSRSFGPKCGIPEDPVCGSAHCQIGEYWAGVLGKQKLLACQASKRGGLLLCELSGNGRIRISGKAVLFAVSELLL